MEKFTQFINYVSFKHSISFDALNKDLEEFVKSERDSIVKTSLSDEYKTYIDNNEERLQAEFDIINEFQFLVKFRINELTPLNIQPEFMQSNGFDFVYLIEVKGDFILSDFIEKWTKKRT